MIKGNKRRRISGQELPINHWISESKWKQGN